MEMKLTPVKYNKTILQEDGVTQKVDTKHTCTGYELSITEMYFEEDKQEVARCVIKDLNRLKVRLIELLEQDQKKDEPQRG